MGKLTVKKVKTAGPGKHSDGAHGLMLRVTPNGSRQWVQRIVIQGKRTDVGLGGFPLVSLATARDKAFGNRQTARAGGNPLADSRKDAPTFAEAAETVIALYEPTWKNSGKSAAQWRASLRDYVLPTLGKRRVDTIEAVHVMAVVAPIWTTKHETARRVRQRISTILQWAVAQGFREDDPAGPILSGALPKAGNGKGHFVALPHGKVADALRTIRASKRAYWSTKAAFEYTVLTAARSGEVRMAEWSEIDLDAAVWTIPGERMKAGKPHRVPLSDTAMAVLAKAAEYRDASELVFPSARGKCMSDSTLSKLLRESGVKATVHGFRSSFRDWAGDTGQVRELAEAALAHTLPSVEGAYARSDLLERRRELTQAWADYIAK